MIDRLIHWSLHNRFLVISGFLALCAWGLVALSRVPIDAIPDLSENQVIVYADWPGRSPQEVEDQITYPLSVSLQGLAGVKSVRASSMFGFSFLTVIFEDKIDVYFARTRVLERLNSLGDLLPEGVVALDVQENFTLVTVVPPAVEEAPAAVEAAAEGAPAAGAAAEGAAPAAGAEAKKPGAEAKGGEGKK